MEAHPQDGRGVDANGAQERLNFDELITARYPLEQINEAVAAVTRGEALPNVTLF